MDAKLPSNTNGTLQSQGHQEVVDEHSVPRARENIAKPRFEVDLKIFWSRYSTQIRQDVENERKPPPYVPILSPGLDRKGFLVA